MATTELLQHEFAHEWFGNQLTNADWDDMWLHEGFGSYMQPADPCVAERPHGLRRCDVQARQRSPTRCQSCPGMPRPRKTSMTISAAARDTTSTSREAGPAHVARPDRRRGLLPLHSPRGLRPAGPLPGNFQPRFGSTNEFEAIASQEAHRDLKWFFDVYLHQAHLPRLVQTRQGQGADPAMETPNGLPFPMPVEVQVDNKRQVVPMTNGRGSVSLPSPYSLVTVDPDSKILRQNDAIDAYRDDLAKNRKPAS